MSPATFQRRESLLIGNDVALVLLIVERNGLNGRTMPNRSVFMFDRGNPPDLVPRVHPTFTEVRIAFQCYQRVTALCG